MAKRFLPTEAERTLIETVIRDHLNGHDIQPCNISIETDDEGSESISVGLCYNLSEKPIDPEMSVDLLAAVRDALIAAGNDRIPYIEHYFDAKQPIGEFSRAY